MLITFVSQLILVFPMHDYVHNVYSATYRLNFFFIVFAFKTK